MKKQSKAILLVSSAALLVATSVLGTIAYLTSTDEVVNTFSVGKVGITLEETKVDENGEIVYDDNNEAVKTTEGNEYRIIPGKDYLKDPTMTVVAGSDEAYLRIMMTISDHEDVKKIVDSDVHGLNGDYASLLTGWDTNNWIYAGSAENDDNTITFEFRYKEKVDGFGEADPETGEIPEEEAVLSPLFTGITIPGTLTSDEVASLDEFKITLVGHAIQATGFTDADSAWAAFDTQNTE